MKTIAAGASSATSQRRSSRTSRSGNAVTGSADFLLVALADGLAGSRELEHVERLGACVVAVRQESALHLRRQRRGEYRPQESAGPVALAVVGQQEVEDLLALLRIGALGHQAHDVRQLLRPLRGDDEGH